MQCSAVKYAMFVTLLQHAICDTTANTRFVKKNICCAVLREPQDNTIQLKFLLDRLEYMMKYVIKNEFIKRASYDSIPRVEHINSMQATESYYKDKLKVYKENAEFNQKLYNKYKDKFEIAKQDLKFHEERANEYRNTIENVTVTIDGHKYKLI